MMNDFDWLHWLKVSLFGIFCGLYVSFLAFLISAGGVATMAFLLHLIKAG
jgi:hypothetical protein